MKVCLAIRLEKSLMLELKVNCSSYPILRLNPQIFHFASFDNLPALIFLQPQSSYLSSFSFQCIYRIPWIDGVIFLIYLSKMWQKVYFSIKDEHKFIHVFQRQIAQVFFLIYFINISDLKLFHHRNVFASLDVFLQ